jgi:serine/threonine-protein kinase
VLRDGTSVFRPDWPAIGVSHEAASAYAAWYSLRTGLPWRLPTETEWEKAARGVDGRPYPWGDFGDGALCHVRTDDHAPTSPAPVARFPTDRSPYGVLGMAGNVREWCADPFLSSVYDTLDPSSRRVVRGGSFRLPVEAARVTSRAGLAPQHGYADVGFRLVRSFR